MHNYYMGTNVVPCKTLENCPTLSVKLIKTIIIDGKLSHTLCQTYQNNGEYEKHSWDCKFIHPIDIEGTHALLNHVKGKRVSTFNSIVINFTADKGHYDESILFLTVILDSIYICRSRSTLLMFVFSRINRNIIDIF